MNHSMKRFVVGSAPCTSSYVSTGASVIAVKSEMPIEAAIVSANCWKSRPVVPGRNATGMKTDIRTNDVAMTAPPISRIARAVASNGLLLSSTMWRTMFSSTTIASSTTKPVASVRPKSVSVLIEKPSSFITANVPISETGIVIDGIKRAVPVLQEDEDDQDDEQDRDQQRDDDFLDRGPHEVGRIEGDLVGVAGRHRLRDLRHRRPHVFRDLKRVGGRLAFDRQHDRRLAVVARRGHVVLRAELDLGDVAEAQVAAIGLRRDDDLLELFGRSAAGR